MSDISVDNHDHEFMALKVIQDSCDSPVGFAENPPAADSDATYLNQREIARSLDMSLDMTNMILKRLATKGWLTMHRINGRNLAYALTPEGTRELARRSYRYLKRTIRGVVGWKNHLNQILGQAKSNGARRVILAGKSDLDFLIDHLCRDHGLGFEAQEYPVQGKGSGSLVLVGEGIEASTDSSDEYSLRDILAQRL